jgi:hypothetical protein
MITTTKRHIFWTLIFLQDGQGMGGKAENPPRSPLIPSLLEYAVYTKNQEHGKTRNTKLELPARPFCYKQYTQLHVGDRSFEHLIHSEEQHNKQINNLNWFIPLW